jgi:hypothetical protein
MQKVILAIVGLVIGIMLVANLLPDVVDEAATDAYSENFSVGSGSTTTTETLSYDHYYGDLRNLGVTSDNENDTPVVMAYDENTREVDVAGLDAGETRILTIDYYREANLQYTGFSAFLRLIPFLAIIGLVIAALWALFSNMRRD